MLELNAKREAAEPPAPRHAEDAAPARSESQRTKVLQDILSAISGFVRRTIVGALVTAFFVVVSVIATVVAGVWALDARYFGEIKDQIKDLKEGRLADLSAQMEDVTNSQHELDKRVVYLGSFHGLHNWVASDLIEDTFQFANVTVNKLPEYIQNSVAGQPDHQDPALTVVFYKNQSLEAAERRNVFLDRIAGAESFWFISNVVRIASQSENDLAELWRGVKKSDIDTALDPSATIMMASSKTTEGTTFVLPILPGTIGDGRDVESEAYERLRRARGEVRSILSDVIYAK